MKNWKRPVAFAVPIGVAICIWAQAPQLPDNFVSGDHPAIQYNQAPLNDPVSKLAHKLESGQVKLEFRKDGTGYAAGLLRALGVNIDSQALVFSKTSFQASRISPANPRAIYFSDDVTVGYVKNSDLMEIAALDPRQGVIFYSFDQHQDPPRFDRRDVCLQCHQSPGTLGVPGLMVASVYPDASGMPAFRGAQLLTDHRSKFEDRWGGWYVTGTHGEMRHNGNAVGHDPAHPELLDMRNTQNLTSLARRFDQSAYLSGLSDIVALMTLEHQTRMTNLIIRVGWERRMLEHDGASSSATLGKQYETDLEDMVAYMLFADEAPLRDKVQGVSTFSKTFPQRGPRDRQGRSLRDFDLQNRLFKYPLSYMIYSEAFDGMPAAARDRLYQRIYNVLSGKDQSPRFARLSTADREAILEILRDTKRGLPAYYQAAAQADE
jgi:hypothetical protein